MIQMKLGNSLLSIYNISFQNVLAEKYRIPKCVFQIIFSQTFIEVTYM